MGYLTYFFSFRKFHWRKPENMCRIDLSQWKSWCSETAAETCFGTIYFILLKRAYKSMRFHRNSLCKGFNALLSGCEISGSFLGERSEAGRKICVDWRQTGSSWKRFG